MYVSKSYIHDLILMEISSYCFLSVGYYGEGLNAMIVFSGCYLPDRSRKDYSYVMENLFLWVHPWVITLLFVGCDWDFAVNQVSSPFGGVVIVLLQKIDSGELSSWAQVHTCMCEGLPAICKWLWAFSRLFITPQPLDGKHGISETFLSVV